MQTRPQLLEIVWEAQPDIQTRTVDMHVQRLRTKLGTTGKLIETVRGFGYRFKGNERGAREPVTFVERLVLGSVLILVLAVAVLLWVAERSLRRDLEGDIGQNLESEAAAGAGGPSSRLDRLAECRPPAGQRRPDIVITLIDRDGRVRADSDFPIGPLPTIENHAQRPEVRAALTRRPRDRPPPE